jgi:hypothetical protein
MVEALPVAANQPEPEPVAIRLPERVKPTNGHARTVAKRRQERAEQLRLFQDQSLKFLSS